MHEPYLYTYKAAFVLTLLIFGNAQADLILAAPPRESLEAGNKLYGPLAKHLTELLGEKVTYAHPDNWLHYQRELRNDVYDVVFDGPHFVSWRIKHLKHSVLVKLPGTLEFYIIAKKANNRINKLKDLIGKKICGVSPPNLGTMTVIEQFRNPVRQPDILPVREGGFGQVAKVFSSGACDAAVLRSNFYNKKLTDEARASTKKLFSSTPLPNQAISVSSRLTIENKNKIVQSLTDGEGLEITRDIVKRFGGKKANSFIVANQKEYMKQVDLLEGVVFGW
ncbi:MAG: phosphate/phosphite/phosphonate ABC transporter substrate-binding protein [Gammaproteobacteria bacterium]|nr:phosphate/phosphite/phosphonate ABC transporter substrate-binding protein [Gammaproteobacteria bacterium]